MRTQVALLSMVVGLSLLSAACSDSGMAPGASEAGMHDLLPAADQSGFDAALNDAAVAADLVVTADLAPLPPDMTALDMTMTSVHTERTSAKMCPMPTTSGTKMMGDACTTAAECHGYCCQCTQNGQTYGSQVCVGGHCANGVNTCIVSYVSDPAICM